MTALEKLNRRINENKFICIGLDSDINKIPSSLRKSKHPLLDFNKQIIDSTHEQAAAYKFNFAFYEKDGSKGLDTLEESISIIPDDILIIGDAKRGDIGNTSQMYASSIFDYFRCDASTVNPYMGGDSIKPFLERDDKINFILALTSNPGAADFEKLQLKDGRFLFQKVIEKVKHWNVKKNCGIVFGATNTDELKENINLINDLPVLLPGVGAQGGSLIDTIEVFKMFNKFNFLINISRGIIYKSQSEDFAIAALKELEKYNSSIQELLKA